jgi:hypothetical protein
MLYISDVRLGFLHFFFFFLSFNFHELYDYSLDYCLAVCFHIMRTVTMVIVNHGPFFVELKK